MKDPAVDWERARTIIRSACWVLAAARRSAPKFVREWDRQDGDCSVLLHDATRLLCRAVSELQGEGPESRWSPELPEMLLSHPELCDDMLARLERGSDEESSIIHCAV